MTTEKRVPGVPDRALEKAMAIANDRCLDTEIDLEALIDWPEINDRKCTRLMRSDGEELVAGSNTALVAALIVWWMGKA